MKPTVSTNKAFMVFGRYPACTVTSSVANNLSSGTILSSPVKDFIRVVFPENKKIYEISRKIVRSLEGQCYSVSICFKPLTAGTDLLKLVQPV